jgi:hypothetical protein
MRRVNEYLLSIWRTRLAAVVGLAGLLGLLSGWLTPRGPLTTGQALVSLAVAFLVGMGAGAVSGSRWTMLVAPVSFVVVLELARLGMEGPTVDAIHLGSTYGIIAFVTGRLAHAVLVLAPMLVGSAYGIALAGYLGRSSPRLGPSGWTVTGLATVALVVVAISIA